MTPVADRRGLIAAMPAVFVLIWSTGFIVARYGMPHAPPMKFLALRYALSIACFLPWIIWARVPWPTGARQWIHLGVTGVLMHAVYLGGVWVAVKQGMGSGLSALIVGVQPVLTAVWLSGTGAGVSRRQWVGLTLGLVGVALVVSRKFGQGGEVSVLTLFAAGLALLGITAGTLYQKHFIRPCDVRSANTVQLLAALMVTLPATLLETSPMNWNAPLIGALTWSVLVLTLGGSSLLYLLIQQGAATAVTSLMYLVPPATAVLAWLLFDEPITVATCAGIALAALGVSLVVRAPKIRLRS